MKATYRLTLITLLLAITSLSAATHYVSVGSTNPTPPYTNWATAAMSIQQAVGVAAAGDEIVVIDGVYFGGVTVTKPLTLHSVNGPQFTAINGGGTNLCANLSDVASLSGFTLTNGAVGAFQGVLSNCTLTGNSGTYGGGAEDCNLYNCTLSSNAAYEGGGACYLPSTTAP